MKLMKLNYKKYTCLVFFLKITKEIGYAEFKFLKIN